jgi:hypothetical protein
MNTNEKPKRIAEAQPNAATTGAGRATQKDFSRDAQFVQIHLTDTSLKFARRSLITLFRIAATELYFGIPTITNLCARVVTT